MPRDVARLGIGRTFQNLQLFDNMTVLENVMCGQHRFATQAVLPIALHWIGEREEAEVRRAALEALGFVGLQGAEHHDPAALPFGHQRLVEIARALALRPRLLLMDEPASGLNDAETERLAELIVRIAALGVTVLVVEHDMRLVMGLADHVVVMDHGEMIARGPPELVRDDPAVIAAYLGQEVPRACCLNSIASPAVTGDRRCCTTSRSLSAAGEIVALIGANGAGKSTLLNTVMGLVATSSGGIRFDGRTHRASADARDRPRRDRAGAGAAAVVRQHVGRGKSADGRLHQRRSPRSRPLRWRSSFSRFPILRQRRRQLARTLSGGEQQMVAIARATMSRPDAAAAGRTVARSRADGRRPDHAADRRSAFGAAAPC